MMPDCQKIPLTCLNNCIIITLFKFNFLIYEDVHILPGSNQSFAFIIGYIYLKEISMSFHKKRFNTKAFISFTTFLSIIILMLSGICLYVSPSGGIAREINWKFLSLLKENWRGMHITFCIFFVVFIIFHLTYNWKVLLAYLKNKLTKKLVFKKEFFLALLIVGILLIFSAFQWFPFSKLLEWRNAIKYKPRVHESISPQDSTNPTAIHFSERKPEKG